MGTQKILANLDLSGQKVTNLGDGSNPADAVTLAQLQAYLKGLVWKPSVKVATTTAITLSGTQTIDGVAVVASDRVLVKDQASAPTNGIYVVAAGAWTRATDLDEAAEFLGGVAVSVQRGTVSADKAYVVATDGAVVVGTTALTWTLLGGSSTSYTAGDGLLLTSTTFSAVPKPSGGLVVDGTGISVDPAYTGLAKRYSVNVPNGSTTAVITHNLGTLDLIYDVVEVATGASVIVPEGAARTTTTISLSFAVAPTVGQYRATVIG